MKKKMTDMARFLQSRCVMIQELYQTDFEFVSPESALDTIDILDSTFRLGSAIANPNMEAGELPLIYVDLEKVLDERVAVRIYIAALNMLWSVHQSVNMPYISRALVMAWVVKNSVLVYRAEPAERDLILLLLGNVVVGIDQPGLAGELMHLVYLTAAVRHPSVRALLRDVSYNWNGAPARLFSFKSGTLFHEYSAAGNPSEDSVVANLILTVKEADGDSIQARIGAYHLVSFVLKSAMLASNLSDDDLRTCVMRFAARMMESLKEPFLACVYDAFVAGSDATLVLCLIHNVMPVVVGMTGLLPGICAAMDRGMEMAVSDLQSLASAVDAVASFLRMLKHNDINGVSAGWETYFRCGTQLLTKMSSLLSRTPALSDALGIFMNAVYDLTTDMQLAIHSSEEKVVASYYKSSFGKSLAYVNSEIFTDALNQIAV